MMRKLILLFTLLLFCPITFVSAADANLIVDTTEISKSLFFGEQTTAIAYLTNAGNADINVGFSVPADLSGLVTLDRTSVLIQPKKTVPLRITFAAPFDKPAGLYSGDILISADGNPSQIKISAELRIVEDVSKRPAFTINPLSGVNVGELLNVQVEITNPLNKKSNFTVKVDMINPATEAVVNTAARTYSTDIDIAELVDIKVPEDIETGDYIVKGVLSYANEKGENLEITSSASVSIGKPLMKTIRPILLKKFFFLTAWQLLLILLFLLSSALAYHEYEVYEEKKRKYNIKVDFSQLPQPSERAAFIGKIAETDIRTFMELDKLQTHTIVAGATGGGKTVAAQVIVEEALNKGVSVIVFDPTAQWTGFLRKGNDRRMLALYKRFNMRKTDAKAFNGNVHQILDARQIIDIKKYVSSGEINIFAINRLDPKDIDMFVANTIREVFHANLDESPELKVLIVYDEVHRLLPKFGGSGEGFIQVERACREFRKWGVGLMLISQVLSDFVGEIKANISTEIQVRTRDEGDLNRIKTKYGEDILSSVVRASVGTGMLENPAYNKGNPYLVSFRPLLHSTTRLSDDELANYNKYNEKIEDLSYQLDQLEELKVDVFDIRLELKLALDKVKSGNFNMVDIYLESLEPRIGEHWQKLGKTPKKRELKLASAEDIKADIEKAKKARADFLKSLKNRKAALPSAEEETRQ